MAARRASARCPSSLLVAAYAIGSHLRRLDNPNDKLLPSLPDMAETFWRMATVPDQRSRRPAAVVRHRPSLARLGGGIVIAAVISVSLGVLIGYLPQVRATLAPFVAVISLIPPITILPILFIIFGLGETPR